MYPKKMRRVEGGGGRGGGAIIYTITISIKLLINIMRFSSSTKNFIFEFFQNLNYSRFEIPSRRVS